MRYILAGGWREREKEGERFVAKVFGYEVFVVKQLFRYRGCGGEMGRGGRNGSRKEMVSEKPKVCLPGGAFCGKKGQGKARI
jgi:hypothetical protein